VTVAHPVPPDVIAGPRLDLVLVPVATLLSRDGEHEPIPLVYPDPHDVLHPDRSPLGFRIAQVRHDPTVNPWLIRMAVTRGASPTIVGLGNFHDRPDGRGMVEIGYRVLPSHRRHGYGREIATTMWAYAVTHPDVRVLRASVSPDNAPSLAIVRGAGLEMVGMQDDPEDGLEWIFEMPAADFRP
jgi:RimJ/RimL family protein N-acetyltransferase